MTAPDPTHAHESEGLVTGATSPRYARQKQRILDAATVFLNQKGVWGMTLQEVAAALDLRTSSVTYYFKRREHLAAAVFEDSMARLADIARRAGEHDSPRSRVAAFLEGYFDVVAGGLAGKSRPFASLSEIRAMDEDVRAVLIEQYQGVLRIVRGFFGPIANNARKELFTARTHILLETLLWADIWLSRFAISNLPHVRRRLFDVLDGGLVIPGQQWSASIIDANAQEHPSEQEAFLSVATRLINDHGYKGASIERITGELNLPKTSFYRRLEGKDELVEACSRDSYQRLAALQRIADRRAASAWDSVVMTLTSALAMQFRGTFPLMRASALQAMPAALRARAVDRSERTTHALMGQLVDAMQEGSVRIVDPLIAAHVMMSALDASYDLKNWKRRHAIEDAVEIYFGIMATGLFDAQ